LLSGVVKLRLPQGACMKEYTPPAADLFSLPEKQNSSILPKLAQGGVLAFR
jgi:hypothetical protein